MVQRMKSPLYSKNVIQPQAKDISVKRFLTDIEVVLKSIHNFHKDNISASRLTNIIFHFHHKIKVLTINLGKFRSLLFA